MPWEKRSQVLTTLVTALLSTAAPVSPSTWSWLDCLTSAAAFSGSRAGAGAPEAGAPRAIGTPPGRGRPGLSAIAASTSAATSATAAPA